MDKILEVNNLKISFRTQSGTLKAVRDISFDLERGETLAIVGESGSGKSVTSKAILGILAGNSITEGGEILFDGKDLLKIDEEEMHKIRGDKIAMIFQDPLSSLNPIVKIGRQITEAMLLKNKASRKMSRKEFNEYLACLKKNMIEVSGKGSEAEINEMVTTFDKFNIVGLRLENAYNEAYNKAEELVADIEELLFMIEKKQRINVKDKLSYIVKGLPYVKNDFLTHGCDDVLVQFKSVISADRSNYSEKNEDSVAKLVEDLGGLKSFLEELVSATRPDFFRIGYYTMKKPDADLFSTPIAELNELALQFLLEDFMNEFLVMAS